MAQTTLLSSITRSASYPVDVQGIEASSNCGTLQLILGSDWTLQMIHELPAINISIYTNDDAKYIDFDIDMSTVNSEYRNKERSLEPIEPYSVAIYNIPENFYFKVLPLFDKNALESHNAQIDAGDVGIFNTTEKGIVDSNMSEYDSEKWTVPTDTFDLTIVFDDSNVSSSGSGGGGSSVTVDTSVDSSSTNPVQNKAIYNFVTGKLTSKVDVVEGKGLSTNDYTDSDKTKLDEIEDYAEKNTIETISVNGAQVTPDTNRNVNIVTSENKNAYDYLHMVEDYCFDVGYSHIDYDYAKEYMRNNYFSMGACTTVRKGNFVGRNFDWSYNEEAYFTIRVDKSESTKYSSIGRTGGRFQEFTNDFVKSGAYSDLYKVLPFITVDGVNECNLVVSANVVPADDLGETTGTTPTGELTDTICGAMLIRYILDNFATATEAVNYIQEHVSVYMPNKTAELRQELHYMVMDKDKTYLLEFINNELVVSDMDTTYDGRCYMANFYMYRTSVDERNHIDVSTVTDYGNGIERYNIVSDNINSVASVTDMTNLMAKLHFTNTYRSDVIPVWKSEYASRQYNLKVTDPIEDFESIIATAREIYAHRERDGLLWQTCHTTVYDIRTGTMYLLIQEEPNENQKICTYIPWKADIIGKRGSVGTTVTVDGVPHIVEANAETFNDTINNIAIGENSHAEGTSTIAVGRHSHAEGYQTKTTHPYAHAEGLLTIASGDDSHAEGDSCEASGPSSHAEGSFTIASGECGHSEGGATEASGDYSHAEGYETKATGEYSHAEGNNTTASGYQSHAEGDSTVASAGYTHAEGLRSQATALMAHAEGSDTTASGNSSHAEGIDTVASGYNSHAEGYKSEAQGLGSHASGNQTIASGDYSYAEGQGTKAQGDYSHAEGALTIAEGDGSHVEGSSSKSIGQYSHAEGLATYANADYSHSEGIGTVAEGQFQHVQGKYNVTDTTSAEIIGNGTGLQAKSNAYTLDWNGNAWFSGDVYVGSTSGTNKDSGSKKLVSETITGNLSDLSTTDKSNIVNAINEVNTKVDNLPDPMIFKGSLGTDGTITTLPAASSDNKGFTYKVITAGTYQGITAEVGDTLISDGTAWVLIPSGDEPSGTVTNVAVTSADGSATITGSPITSSGTIDISVVTDSTLNANSTKPVQNALLSRLFTPLTQNEYDAITNKDLPIYFIYEI